jgi:hypothetical protein
MLRFSQINWQLWVDRLAHWSYLMIAFSLARWFVLGVVAALLGGSLTRLGDGYGGAWGVADLSLTVAMLLAFPSFVSGFVGLFRKTPGSTRRMLAY